MKNKTDFTSFTEDTSAFAARELKSSAKKLSIIKKNQMADFKNIETIRWDEVTENTPDITFIENNGVIEAIEFRCQCGCAALVQLQYGSEEGEEA